MTALYICNNMMYWSLHDVYYFFYPVLGRKVSIMDSASGRLVDSVDPRDEVVAMAMMAYNIPGLQCCDSIAVFPGLGEKSRISHAIDMMNNDTSQFRFLLVAGLDKKRERTSEELTIQLLQDNYDLYPHQASRVVSQIYANNAKHQADWTAISVKSYDIEGLALVVTPFHLLRAYLTLLKSLKNLKIQIPVIPVPAWKAPGHLIEEHADQRMNAWQLVPGEVKRILEYGAKGDLLTYPEFVEYIDWLWELKI